MMNRTLPAVCRPLSAAFAYFSAARFFGALRFYFAGWRRGPAPSV